MSQESLEIVRRCYEAFNRGDIDEWIAFFSEDVELEERFLATEAGTYRGHGGLRQWIAGAIEAMDSPRLEVLRCFEEDDVVVCEVTVEARGASSGVEVTAQLAHAIRLRDRKIVYVAASRTVEEALEAAGLQE
jgi:ketosteroid isomerase-like protein